MTPGHQAVSVEPARTDTANASVWSVAVRSSLSITTVSAIEGRLSNIVLPLASRSIDVCLGALDSPRPAIHVDRIAPLVHSPHATMLQIGGQVPASGSIVVQPTVLLTPLANIGLPLRRAALRHGTNAHAGHEDVKTIASDIASVVDDLIEECVDLARLGAGELGNVASARSVVLSCAGHGSESVAQFRVRAIGPGLLTAALELVATTAAGGVGVIATRASDDRLAVSLADGNRVVNRSLACPATRRSAAIPVHGRSGRLDDRRKDGGDYRDEEESLVGQKRHLERKREFEEGRKNKEKVELRRGRED